MIVIAILMLSSIYKGYQTENFRREAWRWDGHTRKVKMDSVSWWSEGRCLFKVIRAGQMPHARDEGQIYAGWRSHARGEGHMRGVEVTCAGWRWNAPVCQATAACCSIDPYLPCGANLWWSSAAVDLATRTSPVPQTVDLENDINN